MNLQMNSAPVEYEYKAGNAKCDVLILAAGFEDRAYHFLETATFADDAHCILICFDNDISENLEVTKKFIFRANDKFKSENIQKILLSRTSISNFERNIASTLATLPRVVSNIFIDVSGMPNYCICISLNAIRNYYPYVGQGVIYSSAKQYFPTYDEYHKKTDIIENSEFLPVSMATEMSEVLMLEAFSGHRSKEGISCLAIFAGYDAHRSAGVIESINPSMLLLMHGEPGDNSLNWRLDLSRQLHKKFENTRKTASEVVSTLNSFESLSKLEEYYQFLFEDYDFTIAPICSKMQTVATYLFWERYREVQLVFPLPIGYSMDRRPQGVSKTYFTNLGAKNSLFRFAK
ncbi:hypothetical protein [Dyadobacter sp. 22481]|uniref:hypothetical protein n=1 Tax=Dyadobacter sp. 22481 TaxID=3453926 RepID=UPI003F85F2CE